MVRTVSPPAKMMISLLSFHRRATDTTTMITTATTVLVCLQEHGTERQRSDIHTRKVCTGGRRRSGRSMCRIVMRLIVGVHSDTAATTTTNNIHMRAITVGGGEHEIVMNDNIGR